MSEEKFVYTACPGWGDHDYCAIKTIVKDGRIERTERIVYSDPEEPDGHICQKGCLAARMPYDPNRLTAPLKRAGERGEGKWETISWDQALDEIAEKLNAIREKHGPESVVMWSFPAGPPSGNGFPNLMPVRFANVFGCTNPTTSIGLDNGCFYSDFYQAGMMGMHVYSDARIIEGTDLVYVWGCNPIENQMRAAQALVRARDAGARIVDIGLIFDGTAGWADEFVGVKPGSDGDLCMAFMNYIFTNDKYDRAYIIDKTNLAYLIRQSDGMMAMDADGNYLIYDQSAGKIAPVAPAGGEYPSQDLALEGCFELDGQKLVPAFQLLKDRALQYTPEVVAETVGIAPELVERLARDYAEADNAFIFSGYGMRYGNSTETYRMLHILGALTGRLGKPLNGVIETLQLNSYPIMFNDGPITFPEGPENAKSVGIRMSDWFDSMKGGEGPYKALIVPCGNPVHQMPDRGRWLDILQGMELVVDFDVWLTDTGEVADYVLPDLMSFEKTDIITSASYNHIVLQEPAIEGPEGCHDAVYLFSELAKRCGLGEYFDKTVDEWLEIRLQTDYPMIATIEPKVDLARLKQEKMIRVNAPVEPKFDPWMAPGPLPTKTGRLEIYAERLAELDLAVTRPRQTLRIAKGGEYPYQLFTGRQRFFMQSSFTDDPINIAMSGGTPATRLNPKDAFENGLFDGDKVEVYNDRGHVVTRLDIDESVPPGTVHVWFGWRARQFEEGTYAEMASQCGSSLNQGEVEDKWFADWVADGHSINSFVDLMALEAGGVDTYWDSWCNIRKYEKTGA